MQHVFGVLQRLGQFEMEDRFQPVVQDMPAMQEGNSQDTPGGRKPRENQQRHGHDFRRLVRMYRRIDPGFSVER